MLDSCVCNLAEGTSSVLEPQRPEPSTHAAEVALVNSLRAEEFTDEAIRSITQGVNVNAEDEYGNTALHYAVNHNTTTPTERLVAVETLPTPETRSEINTAKDSGYVSDPRVGSTYEDAQPAIPPLMGEVNGVNEGNDGESLKSISTIVDLGPDRKLWSITTFAQKIVNGLSPDMFYAVQHREETQLVVQEALNSFSYSVERDDQFSKQSPERQASTFVRQQSV